MSPQRAITSPFLRAVTSAPVPPTDPADRSFAALRMTRDASLPVPHVIAGLTGNLRAKGYPVGPGKTYPAVAAGGGRLWGLYLMTNPAGEAGFGVVIEV